MKDIVTNTTTLELLDYITDGMLMVDAQWTIVYANRKAERLLLRSREELIGKNVGDVFPETARHEFFAQCRKAADTREPVSFEAYFPLPGIRFDVRCRPDGGGLSICFSERVQSPEELRKTKDMLESFVENSADAIWVIDLDENVLEINAAFETMFRCTAVDVIGKRLPIVPDFLTNTIKSVHDRVKRGKSVIGFETVRQRADGTLVHVSASLSPICAQDGTVIGLAGVCRDISERKLAEKALQQTKEQLEAFIENNVDAILMFDRDGNTILVNEAFKKMFGWGQAELAGVHLLELSHIPEDRKGEVRDNLHILQSGGSIRGQESRRIRKDGTAIDVSVTCFPNRDPFQQLNGWSAVLRDISECKNAQEMFRNAEKLNMAGQLAAGIAHEIRNPITTIKGFVQLMKSGSAHKQQQYLDIMGSEIERIESILSELLVLAKPQAAKFERKDIVPILTQVVTLLDTQAILNNVLMTRDFFADSFYLMCDANQLKQVFINFLKNAIEAMPDGGTLTVQLRRGEGGQAVVRIVDQGCGIPKHIVAKLGQPFYTTKEKGTGLGFMISKRIIENHDGQLYVFSKENEGTTVEVVLPAAL